MSKLIVTKKKPVRDYKGQARKNNNYSKNESYNPNDFHEFKTSERNGEGKRKVDK